MLTVAAGTFLVVFFYCWLAGVMDEIVSSSAKFSTGHVKVMTRAYRELSFQVPNDLAILDVSDLINSLNEDQPDMLWTPRIRFGGLLDIPDAHGETRAQGPIMGLGIDLFSADSPEIDILNLKNALTTGSLPKKSGDILISDEFSKKLGIKIGETATLMGSTMNGGMAMYNFTVSGTVKFGITAMDRGAIIADISDVQAALDMPDGAGEVLGYHRLMLYSDEHMTAIAEGFNEKYSKANDEFAPIMLTLGEQDGLKGYLNMVAVYTNIFLLIFLFAMSIVLWNSGLMNGLRRYGEIGVRLAMGEPKGRLYRWMIYESIVTGIIGTVLGTALGVAAGFYLQENGIDFGSIMKDSTLMMNNVMRARVTGLSYVIGFFPGLAAPVIGSLFAGVGIYKRETAQLFKELEV